MDNISVSCGNYSVGGANHLFNLVLQTILTAQCTIGSPNEWPKDYGPEFIENGDLVIN